jgi:hypothetical protein
MAEWARGDGLRLAFESEALIFIGPASLAERAGRDKHDCGEGLEWWSDGKTQSPAPRWVLREAGGMWLFFAIMFKNNHLFSLINLN